MPSRPLPNVESTGALDRVTPTVLLLDHGVRVYDLGRRAEVQKLGASVPSLIITRRWFSPLYVPTAIIAVLLLGILISTRQRLLADAADPKVALILVAWVLIAAAAAHTCLSSLLNRTTLRVGGGMLSLRRGPFPPRKELRIAAAEIAAVSFRQRTLTGGAWFSAEDGHAMVSQARRRYDLGVDRKDGRHVVLLRGFASPEPLTHLKELLEAHLRLEGQG